MPAPQITKGQAFQDGGVALMARIVGNSAVNITQGSITSIALTVLDANTRDIEIAEAAIVVATAVFDALQTDDRWTVDSTGYNFRDDVPAASLADGNKTYRFEYAFTPASGAVFFVVFHVTTLATGAD